jgi:hypothetical protein
MSKYQIMKLTTILSLFSCLILLSACSNPDPKPTEPTAETVTPPVVGADADEHGCKASAGYTWSAIRNECIRLFETGIRLDPQDSSLDKTVSAFIVFKTADDDAKAEVYLPNGTTAQIFEKQPNAGAGDAGTWKGSDATIKYWKGMYMLEDANKKLLYQGMWDNK